MLSFTVVDVGTAEEFWQPLFDFMIKELNLNGMREIEDDLFLYTNFVYIVAAQ